MRFLFRDLLPDEILSRHTKAHFNGVAFSEHSRAFVERWTGRGVNSELVDPEELMSEWRSSTPSAGTMVLLQAAWLAEEAAAPETYGRA